MASDYDYLPISNGSGDSALMHVTGTRIIGATTIAVDSVANVPAKFIATSGTLLPTGYIDPTTVCNFKGHTSSGSLVIDAFEPGSTDAGNTAGQVVIIKPNTGWANRVAQFIKNATNLGTPEAMTASTLTVTTGTTLPAGDIGTADIAGAAITFAKLASAIFSGQVTTYSNPGSAGGTFYYANIGGIKLMWGTTSDLGTGTFSNNITMPSGFFSTMQTGLANTVHVGGTNDIYADIQSYSTTSAAIGIIATLGSGTATVGCLFIGT